MKMICGNDRGNRTVVYIKSKKKNGPPSYRRLTGIHISEPQLDDISPRPSYLYSRLTQQSHTAPSPVGLLHDRTKSLSAPFMAPSQGYQTLDGGYMHLPSVSVVPSASSSRSSTATSTSRSMGLTSLRLRDSPSTPNTHTTGHLGAVASQPGNRDASRRTYIIPYGFGFWPDNRIAKIIFKCLARHYKGIWHSWSKIPPEFKMLVFNEFKKELLHYWDIDPTFKKKSELRKKARASTKGGSLHTTRAISQIAMKNKMEKSWVG